MPKQTVRTFKGYRVRPYAHGWQIQGKYVYFDEKRNGLEVWEDEGSYFGSFENACASIIDKKLTVLFDTEEPVNALAAIQQAKQEAIQIAKEFNVTLVEARKILKTTETEE